MSCKSCDETVNVAYYRVGNANVGLIGCDKHLNELMRAVDGREEDRVIYRVKAQCPHYATPTSQDSCIICHPEKNPKYEPR